MFPHRQTLSICQLHIWKCDRVKIWRAKINPDREQPHNADVIQFFVWILLGTNTACGTRGPCLIHLYLNTRGMCLYIVNFAKDVQIMKHDKMYTWKKKGTREHRFWPERGTRNKYLSSDDRYLQCFLLTSAIKKWISSNDGNDTLKNHCPSTIHNTAKPMW